MTVSQLGRSDFHENVLAGQVQCTCTGDQFDLEEELFR